MTGSNNGTDIEVILTTTDNSKSFFFILEMYENGYSFSSCEEFYTQDN